MEVLNKPGGFSGHDMELLSLMSLYSSAEIQAERLRRDAETARLLQWELDMAREVQKNLLPHGVLAVPGIAYEGFFQPAESVGGDFYDFLQSPGNLFSITLGDVSGKGMPAAVLMASLQTLLRSHLLRQPLPLSQLVAEVSHTLYLCSSPDRYATLFCGVLDAERRQLTYVNAGHPQPILLRSGTKTIERLATSGLPIGVFPASRCGQTTVDVYPGDLIVCISDGVSELTNAAEEMWENVEMERLVLAHKDKSVQDLVAQLVSRIRDYSLGTVQSDDITITAIQVMS